ncbi:uncharacterized protein LTR77_001654 [Saxophila tyrrhenica]|uniref:Solute carrier family 39 member 9 n=1 Tax=Saxophila tyrrhenica TaxID=1690608 RepID=A0AAV9PKQ8_9PEZI|nr:hypothetical protein LTR77_001654 [Saxophila tyrrhenica]
MAVSYVLSGPLCFLAGILPLSFSLSSRQLRLVTALGTGVLVGTSMIVIIPEGIETLYEASGSSHSHAERSIRVATRSSVLTNPMPGAMEHNVWRQTATAMPNDLGLDGAGLNCMVKRQDDGQENSDHLEDSNEHEANEHHDEEYNPHAWVGFSLITGFILMYLVDTLPRHVSGPSQPQRFHISLNQFSLTRSRTSSGPEPPTDSSTTHHGLSGRPSSTTVGLVIHAIADGIALGASSATTSRLSFIIFFALMIHKAPAAFGLTSVLLKQGLSKRAARAHLIVFSLAAPVGALLTWGAAHILGYSSAALGRSMSAEFATGVLLLFSAGTFMYVAMHTMQEGSHSRGSENGQINGYSSVPMSDMSDMYASTAPTATKTDAAGLTDTMVCVAGMLLPLLTNVFGHGH